MKETTLAKRDILKTKKIGKKHRLTSREIQVYTMCFLPLLLIFVFNYLPMGGTIIAFKNYRFDKGIFGSDWIGFRNFEFFVTSSEVVKLLRNTLGMNFVFIITGTISSLILAFILYELQSRRATKVFQTMLITPNFLSWVVVSYMVYAFLHPQNGILNQFLAGLGMETIDWYNKPEAWPFILTIATIWKNVGMDSVVYYAALMGTDTSLIEAAKIDGANKLQINFKIVLPTLIPIITVLSILKVGNIFRADFGLFYQLPRQVVALYPTTDVIDTYIFRVMREIGDMGMSTAVGLLQSVVGCILVIATNACVKKIDDSMSLF